MKRRTNTWASLALLAILSGCSAMGPRSVGPDRFDYNQAIMRSRDEQILLNLVRARYLELPSFLEVSSVLSQYTYSASLGANASFDLYGANGTGGGSSLLSYAERPTISFSPMRGEEFIRRMMSPLPAEIIFALGQGGWPMDLLIPLCIQRMNNVGNMSFAAIVAEDDKEKFDRFTKTVGLFAQLSDRHCLEVWRDEAMTEGVRYIAFNSKNEADEALIRQIKEDLQLDSEISTFEMTARLTQRQSDEITIQPRSFLSVLFVLSRGVLPPEVHLDEGWAPRLPTVEGWVTPHLPLPFEVRCQESKPDDAFVSIRYQNHWFSIPHSDLPSKRVFAMLNFLFSLQASADASAVPLLTVPAGR